MANNRFFTILIIPEKTSQVKRVMIPTWMIRGASVGLALVILLAGMMIFDYGYVMSQIGENKQLKLENRKLRQQVQVFQNKMATVESTMERVKSFATRLKVIMNIEEQGPVLQGTLPSAQLLSTDLPEFADVSSGNRSEKLGNLAAASHLAESPNVPDQVITLSAAAPLSHVAASAAPEGPSQVLGQISGPAQSLDQGDARDPEQIELHREYIALEDRISRLTREAFYTEELLQDQYEILYDKKAFLAALPTRQPAAGYFTSGFGIRRSPYGDRIKMHEGLDIANRIGTAIRAPANGEVIFADSKAGYGLTVILNHGYGIETWFGHLKKTTVTKGEQVRRGDQIALMGNSGRSTGPHVHYEVRVRGYPVDPRSYIFEQSAP